MKPLTPVAPSSVQPPEIAFRATSGPDSAMTTAVAHRATFEPRIPLSSIRPGASSYQTAVASFGSPASSPMIISLPITSHRAPHRQ